MAVKSYSASAPGTMMLFGEHAVLRGKMAVCAATDQRLSVIIVPRDDDQIIIDSEIGQYQTCIGDVAVEKPFQFILACVKQQQLTVGANVRVVSTFKHTLGLGSSAAVTVATIAALWQWQGMSFDKKQLVTHAKNIIRQVQACGSGADVAACVYGGVVAYHMQPMMIQPLLALFDISLVYSGHKEKTADVIALVAKYEKQDPAKYIELFEQIDTVTQQAITAITDNNLMALAHCMRAQQQLMHELGVSNEMLDELISLAQGQEGILAAKISGSGLGDCIVTLGRVPDSVFPVNKKQKHAGVVQLEVLLSICGLEVG